MKITDGALLAIVVDDDEAMRVLAVWGGLALRLDQAETDETIARLVEIAGGTESRVRRAVARLITAQAIVDGGVSELADKMLQAYVQLHIQRKPKR